MTPSLRRSSKTASPPLVLEAGCSRLVLSLELSLLIVAPFFWRERFGTRFRISRGFLAGRCRTVEGRNSLSAMGGMGQSRIWRAAVYFLSAALVAARSRIEFLRSVELRSRGVYRFGADFRGTFSICFCAPLAAGAGGALRRGLLRGEPQRAADHLHAQRLCGASGVGLFSAAFSGGVATCRHSGESPRLMGRALVSFSVPSPRFGCRMRRPASWPPTAWRFCLRGRR